MCFILYAIFCSHILNFCTLHLISYVLSSPFSFVIFLIFLCIVGESLRSKNFIANDCFHVVVVHMTIKILNLESYGITSIMLLLSINTVNNRLWTVWYTMEFAK